MRKAYKIFALIGVLALVAACWYSVPYFDHSLLRSLPSCPQNDGYVQNTTQRFGIYTITCRAAYYVYLTWTCSWTWGYYVCQEYRKT
jgi:hypothetical protein